MATLIAALSTNTPIGTNADWVSSWVAIDTYTLGEVTVRVSDSATLTVDQSIDGITVDTSAIYSISTSGAGVISQALRFKCRYIRLTVTNGIYPSSMSTTRVQCFFFETLGDAGPTGANGPTGPVGPTGAQGPTGSSESSNWIQVVDSSGNTNISSTPTTAILNVGQTTSEISGKKFFYDPVKGFCYIGADNVGTGSTNANRGTNSVCLNTSSICRGTSSLSTGSAQIHGGSFNVCGGNGQTFIGQVGSTTGDYNFCYGDDSSIRNTASNNFVFGRASSVRSTGSYCMCIGNNVNSLFGSNNFLMGVSCGTTSFTNAFIYNSNSGSQLNSSANNQISFNGFGGYRLFTDATNTVGVSLAPSANAWAIISDRNMKEDIVEANYEDVLAKVEQVPIYHYRFKSRERLKQAHQECGYSNCCPDGSGQCPYENTLEVNPLCFGAMSQDWNAVFSGNPQDPLSINTNEVMFSAIAAIKALSAQVKQLRLEIDELKAK